MRSPIFTKDRGDIDWCYQKVYFLKMVYEDEQRTLRQWDDAISDLKTFRAWEKIPEDSPYGSLEALLKAEIGVESEEAGAQAVRQRMAKAAGNTTGEVLPEGRPKKLPDSGSLTQRERAKENGVSRDTQQRLDRLAREKPEIHQLVAHGELSVAAAERAAGFAKKKAPLDKLLALWKKASEEERRTFLDMINAHSGESHDQTRILE